MNTVFFFLLFFYMLYTAIVAARIQGCINTGMLHKTNNDDLNVDLISFFLKRCTIFSAFFPDNSIFERVY